MRHVIDTIVASLRRLVRQCDGNVAMMFGLCAIPAIIAGGMAIDVGRAYMVKIRLGAALDAAALAVGSETNQTQTQLQTDLQNYFTANYPSTALGTNVTVTPVPANVDLTSAVINWQAQATVPMTVMQLVGVNSITVTVSAQTKKTVGLEIAVVLDNTGSMLCGASDSNCSSGVVSSDTTCTNSGNNSRICTLIKAATSFVNTLTSAINSAQQLYVSIVPYVTTVNVGDSFCTGTTSCSHITTTGGKFTDLRGDMMPVTPIIGTTSSGSNSISSVSMLTPSGSVSGTAAIQPGMYIYGRGIPSGATISSVSSSSITISSNATLTFTGNSLAVGPNSGNTSTPYTDPTTCTTTGTWTTTSPYQLTSVANTTNTCVATGMVVTSTSTGIRTSPATTVSSISGSTVGLSQAPTQGQSNKPITFSLAGNTTNGSATITNLKGTTASLTSIVVGMGISGTGIPANAYVTSINTSTFQLTMSANATSTNTSDIVTLTNLGATTTTGSTTVSNVSFSTLPSVGQIILGNGIPANTTITAVTGTSAQFAAGTGSLTISQNATTPSTFSSATGTCCNTQLFAFASLTYDSAYNTASPAGSSTTANWGGCVIEPTSSGENASGTGVLAVSGNPDTSEPTSGLSWYPYYWVKDNANNWASGVSRQDTTTEIQGNVSSEWLAQDGPNQGCPVSVLPLTDATTTTGKAAILNKISSMWTRDAGGTQVHIGMVWGWRTLSPTGPFTAVNGHPLSYSDTTTTGWKKVVVLMTDGEEEWPATANMTGLGQIADGKIGTTSTSTAVTNLNSRLTSVCSNMAAQGYIIYAIGLGPGGSSNTQLQNCAVNGGFYEAATPSNLQTVFNDVAKSLIALRLSQ
ncbi:MAG: pilus assembly protein TadG-related protein [Stellaceae bacterium]